MEGEKIDYSLELKDGILIIPSFWVGSEWAATATNKWQCLAEAASK